MNPKRILLIGGNYWPEPTGIGKFNGEMMEWLADNGYDCTVVTTYPYYPQWKVVKGLNAILGDKKNERIKIYRCKHYVPANPTGIKRMASDLSFFITAWLRIVFLLFQPKHDLIITVVPPFHLGILGMFYRFFKGGKLVYHIQDLQVDAARDFGLIKSKSILRMLFSLEKWMIRKADVVSTISPGMIEKVKQKVNRPVLFFPNWADVSSFFPLNDNSSTKQAFKFLPADKIILYSGAIGEKQGLENLIRLAKHFSGDASLKFVICGTGPYKEKLILLKKELDVQNVFFFPLQPIEELNALLNMADIHLVLQKENAGNLVMPSKLANILAVGGLPIVTAEKGTSLYDVVSKNDIGVVVAPENEAALEGTIIDVLNGLHAEKRINARRYAENYISKDEILKTFVGNLMSECFQVSNNKVPTFPTSQNRIN